ncbi:MAG: hypothetical protein QGI18_09355 [Candidatus Marinimicrobia bacterium]|nr:hypothetical protein [Candidatus Neomarinimicrobiota bacterium]
MKRFLLLFLLTLLLYGQEASVQGDPSELSQPGGYIGISYEFDKKNTIKGYQIAIGFAVPSIGNPGQGPYLFPGFAFGKKYSSKENKSYTYNDLQITYFGYGGFWSGAGYGIAFIDGKKLKRSKYYGGFLLAGYYKENIDIAELDSQNNTFSGYHLGLALPIIGNHFHP